MFLFTTTGVYALPISPIIPFGATLPATCRTGSLFIDTDADTDGALYQCVATDTWKIVSGASGGTVDISGTPGINDIARFTDGDTIEGLSYAELKSAMDLEEGTDFYSVSAMDTLLDAKMDVTWGTPTAKVCGDANPEGIANGGFYDFSNVGAYTITDFEDTDGDHTDYNEGDWFLGKFGDTDITVDFSENANIEGNAGVDFTGSATQITYILFVYESARWNAVNLTGGYSTPTTLGLASIEMGSGTLEIPNDESADKTLANMGEVHIRGDEDSFNAHYGAGGEIAGEASISALTMFTMPIDFTYVYDRDANHRIFLFEVNAKVYPNGITLDYVRVSYTKDPTTEITNADLKRADDIIGVANAAIIVGIDTTAGSFIEDTDANLNAGAVVAAGQDIYIELTDDPVDEDVLANVTILFHAEAD